MVNQDLVGICFDEPLLRLICKAIADVFSVEVPSEATSALPGKPRKLKGFLTQPVFHENRSETEMMRFLRKLADKDLALDRTMIPLGSCTMKLNAAAEMIPVSWPTVANLHPFAPKAHSKGYRSMTDYLEALARGDHRLPRRIASAQCRQPGEYAGLLAIRRYHASRGETASEDLPHPLLRARHQSGERGYGRHGRHRGEVHSKAVIST